MKKNVVTLDLSKTVLDAVRIMAEQCVGCLVITELDKPVGIITERDIMRSILQDRRILERSAKEVMSRPLLAVEPETTVVDALDLMKKKEIRHLPVVAGEQLQGVITMHSDLFYWALGTSKRDAQNTYT
jgi:CBS domain-containing protein